MCVCLYVLLSVCTPACSKSIVLPVRSLSVTVIRPSVDPSFLTFIHPSIRPILFVPTRMSSVFHPSISYCCLHRFLLHHLPQCALILLFHCFSSVLLFCLSVAISLSVCFSLSLSLSLSVFADMCVSQLGVCGFTRSRGFTRTSPEPTGRVRVYLPLYEIYIAFLQGNYSEALPAQTREKSKVLSSL